MATDDEVYRNLTPDEVRLIVAYANNGMRLSPAARDSFYNWRSAQYHLERIYKNTRLNPRDFFDLVKLMKVIANHADDT